MNDDTYFAHSFVQGNDSIPYRIMYPKGYYSFKKYPLILFLHGAGERGHDNVNQLSHGSSLFQSDSLRSLHQAIVVMPQCPHDIMWTHRVKTKKDKTSPWEFEFPLRDGPTRPSALVNALVDSLIKARKVDPKRMYIGGLSMGGIGTLEYLHRWPKKYAAAFVICGGHDPKRVHSYKDKPIWFFHGGKDDVVPTHYSKAVYNQLKLVNPDNPSKYTLYPDNNHNSWDAAFSEPGLYEWLFRFENKQQK